MQQHAEAVDGPVAARTGSGEQWGFQRHVDHVAHDGVALQRGEIDRKRRLPDHAERRAVDEEIGGGQQARQRLGAIGVNPGPETGREIVRALGGPVGDGHVEAARDESVDRRSCGASRADDHGVRLRDVPPGRAVVEAGDEAVDVRIAADKRRALEPHGVDGADRLGRVVAPMHEAIRRPPCGAP